MKYRPEFPDHFSSFEHAHEFIGEFVPWYNTEHRHSGIAMLTPAMVHNGHADRILAARQEILRSAYEATPDRFVHGKPKRLSLPAAVWINPPTHDETAA